MIQDFGEKIGGAKKDLWRRRGLNVTDLITMTEKEKREFIKKKMYGLNLIMIRCYKREYLSV